jgi:hypothetical protein
MVGIQNAMMAVSISVFLIDGYRARGTGFFRWPMFSNHCAVVADLFVVSCGRPGRELKMFHHLPAHAPWLTPRDFDVLLEYFSRQGVVCGSGVFYGNNKVYEFEVKESRVAVRRICS